VLFVPSEGASLSMLDCILAIMPAMFSIWLVSMLMAADDSVW
jgi:hypothetical protein